MVVDRFEAAHCPPQVEVQCFQTIDARVRSSELEVTAGPTFAAFVGFEYLGRPLTYSIRAVEQGNSRWYAVDVEQLAMGASEHHWSMYAIREIRPEPWWVYSAVVNDGG